MTPNPAVFPTSGPDIAALREHVDDLGGGRAVVTTHQPYGRQHLPCFAVHIKRSTTDGRWLRSIKPWRSVRRPSSLRPSFVLVIAGGN